MNIRSSRIITVAIILLGTLVMLGAAGAISPASAAVIAINSDAKVTNYAQVTLTIAPPVGYVDMRFQNDLNAPSAWEPVAVTKRWTLPAGDGVKTVKVQFRDANTITTNINDPLYRSTIILDSIIDTSFNAASATYPGTANYANTASVLSSATAANAVAVHPNTDPNAGKTVTVGTYDNGNGNTDIKVVRYNTNGTLDIQYVFEHAGADSGNGVAIQPDGKIVVVGTISRGAGVTDIFLLRLNSNGTPDTAFGVNGVIDYIASGRDNGNAVAIQADGKIVVAGTFDVTSVPGFAYVLRFNPDGTKDLTFAAQNGGDQGAIAFFGGKANAVAVQADQKIVVVGTYNNGPTGTSAWVMRLNSNGTEDTSFNPAGSSPGHNFFGSNGAHSGNAVAINSATNKIVVVGTFAGSQAWVLQLNSNGTLDTTFNTVGDVALDGPVSSSGSAVAIQPDGRIVVVGTYGLADGTTSVFAARLNNIGTLATTLLDTTFNYGNYDYAFGIGANFVGKAVALQPDGKIVVAGIGDAHRLLASIPAGSTSMLTLRLHEKTYPVNVTIIGSGTVAVFPGTLTGGTGNFVPASTIELTATPVGGATFSGWSGACTGTGTCTVLMDAAKNVTATFTQFFPLTVSVTGVGTVSSAPGTISCASASGPGCSESFTAGTPVTLTATPTWYTLNGLWSGACSGSIATACTVTMDQARTVGATFISSMNARVVNWGDYPTLTEAYSVANASGPAATIQAKNILFPVMTFHLPVTATLQGGKGSDFSAAAVGYTYITGPLFISNGVLKASYLKIKP